MNFAVYLTLLAFVAINFVIIFFVKSRTSTVISLIASHLVFILFLALTIEDYSLLQEIILAVVIYVMTLLFLISNHSNTHLINESSNLENKEHSKVFKFAVLAIATVIFILLSGFIFHLENVGSNNTTLSNEKSSNRITVSNQKADSKLQDNFLLKRSSDVILIIVASASLILLFSAKKFRERKE